jgi:hypothetical protein
MAGSPETFRFKEGTGNRKKLSALFVPMDSSERMVVTVPVACSFSWYTFSYIIDAEL